MNVYVIQRSEGIIPGPTVALKFVCLYGSKEQAIIFAETALQQLHGQLLINGFHRIVQKENNGDVTIGLVNMKTETPVALYVIQQVQVL